MINPLIQERYEKDCAAWKKKHGDRIYKWKGKWVTAAQLEAKKKAAVERADKLLNRMGLREDERLM